jgi:hypothetical protein
MRHYVSTGFGTFQGGAVTKYLTFPDLKQIHFVFNVKHENNGLNKCGFQVWEVSNVKNPSLFFFFRYDRNSNLNSHTRIF